jgi:hypothetical protein
VPERIRKIAGSIAHPFFRPADIFGSVSIPEFYPGLKRLCPKSRITIRLEMLRMDDVD